MSKRIDNLLATVQSSMQGLLVNYEVAHDELTVECDSTKVVQVCSLLRDLDGLRFEQLIDLCGVDYSDYADGLRDKPRFAVVYHMLSISLNHRIRLKVFVDDDFPVLSSVVDVWSAANWFEREAFDLYGIMFDGHPDLRRLLTDYGFVGHPFRKDFPMIGNVEMRYDPEQQRVIYQPVSIELRNNVPRVIRDEGFHNG